MSETMRDSATPTSHLIVLILAFFGTGVTLCTAYFAWTFLAAQEADPEKIPSIRMFYSNLFYGVLAVSIIGFIISILVIVLLIAKSRTSGANERSAVE
jgi:hypothetical protein